jgi:hypothetical protein
MRATIKNDEESSKADTETGDGGDVTNSSADELESKLEDLRALLALRWYYQMIAEKNCVLVAGFVTKFAVTSPHRLGVHVCIVGIFLTCEIISDVLLGYFMEYKYNVPFCRVVRNCKIYEREFWVNEIMLCLVTVCTALAYCHARLLAEVWF